MKYYVLRSNIYKFHVFATAAMPIQPASTESPETADASLQADVAALRERFPETRALYREVCGLLFFRYGITPTANKLYGLVRKGSMGTPLEVLGQFWQDLREQARVRIEHPGLPDAIKQVAADAVQQIWQAASESAASELAALRDEAGRQAGEAQAQRDQARAAVAAAERETAAVAGELEAARQALAALRTELDAERQAHAATRARLEEGRNQAQAQERQLGELRAQFSAELERAREQAAVAQERAGATERRALREIDQERTLRQKGEQAAADLRAELSAAQARAQEAAVAGSAERARLQAEGEALRQRLASAERELAGRAQALDALRAELEAAARRAGHAEAQAAALRRSETGRRKVPVARTRFAPGKLSPKTGA